MKKIKIKLWYYQYLLRLLNLNLRIVYRCLFVKWHKFNYMFGNLHRYPSFESFCEFEHFYNKWDNTIIDVKREYERANKAV